MPLRSHAHLTLALEADYQIDETPIPSALVETVEDQMVDIIWIVHRGRYHIPYFYYTPPHWQRLPVRSDTIHENFEVNQGLITAQQADATDVSGGRVDVGAS